jgi:hypothetical protein
MMVEEKQGEELEDFQPQLEVLAEVEMMSSDQNLMSQLKQEI